MPGPLSLDTVNAQSRATAPTSERAKEPRKQPKQPRGGETDEGDSQISASSLSRSTAETLTSPRLLNGPQATHPPSRDPVAGPAPVAHPAPAIEPTALPAPATTPLLPAAASPGEIQPESAEQPLRFGGVVAQSGSMDAAPDAGPSAADPIAQAPASGSADHMYDNARIETGRPAPWSAAEPTAHLVPGSRIAVGPAKPAAPVTVATPVSPAAPPRAMAPAVAPGPQPLAVRPAEPVINAVICVAGCPAGAAGVVVDAQPLPVKSTGNANPGIIRAALVGPASVQQSADTIMCIAGCYSSPRSYAARNETTASLVRRANFVPASPQKTGADAISISAGQPAASMPATPAAVGAARPGKSSVAKFRPARKYSSSTWFTSRFKGQSSRH